MKKTHQILILILGIFLSMSCYDDLGNYDYNNNINLVEVKLDKIIGIKKVDGEYVIRPEIKQKTTTDNSNLRYLWRMSTRSDEWTSSGDTISTADTAAILINTKAVDFKYTYWVRLYIEDTITHTTYMFPTTISIVQPYEGCWTVLHRKGNTTQLATVEYITEQMIITEDAYYKERGKRLEGNPIALGTAQEIRNYPVTTVFYCFTDKPEESGILSQNMGFQEYATMDQIIYEPDKSDYDPTNIIMPGGHSGAGPFFITNGKVFQGSATGPRFHSMQPAANVTGEYYISHAANAANSYLIYDKIGRRFMNCYTGKNQFPGFDWGNVTSEIGNKKKMELIANTSQTGQGVNLNDIGTDKEMVYIGEGFQYGPAMATAWARISLYALAKSKTENKAWIYEFHAYPLSLTPDKDDPAPLSAVIPINTPSGMTAETPCASSIKYNRILFYAVGNNVYKLDFGQTNGYSQLIWQHPDPNAEIKIMRMARTGIVAEKEEFTEYGYSLNCTLGIAVDMPDGSGELVVLHLTTSARVATDGKYPAIQRHTGFGKIKDIVFI